MRRRLLVWRLLQPAAAPVLLSLRLLTALGPLRRNPIGGLTREPLRLLRCPCRVTPFGPRRRRLSLWRRRSGDLGRRRGTRTRRRVNRALAAGIRAPRALIGAPPSVVRALRALVRTLRVALARSRRRLGRLRGSELARLRRALALDLAVAERRPRGYRPRGRRLRRRHDTRRRRADPVRPPGVAALAVTTLTFCAPALGSRLGRTRALSTRGSRGDHGAGNGVLGRPRGVPGRRDVARRAGRDPERCARGLEAARVHLRDPRVLDRASPELLLADCDHGVLDAGVLVDVDVRDVHDRRAVHHDVVDDARPAPARPRRPGDELRSPPPRHQRLAPAERDPADARDANRDADARTTEERDQRGSIDGPDDHGPRRPGPDAAHGDPAAVVIW